MAEVKYLSNDLRGCFELAESLGWSVCHEDGNVYDFGKRSPAGQDFHMSIDTENDVNYFRYNLRGYCRSFDVCQEAYLWLDDTGHGKNGAPYDMKDVYEDMEACLEMIEELANEIEALEFAST